MRAEVREKDESVIMRAREMRLNWKIWRRRHCYGKEGAEGVGLRGLHPGSPSPVWV